MPAMANKLQSVRKSNYVVILSLIKSNAVWITSCFIILKITGGQIVTNIKNYIGFTLMSSNKLFILMLDCKRKCFKKYCLQKNIKWNIATKISISILKILFIEKKTSTIAKIIYILQK